MSLSCIVFEIQQVIGQKSRIFLFHLHSLPIVKLTMLEFYQGRWWTASAVMSSSLTCLVIDCVTDGRTDMCRQHWSTGQARFSAKANYQTIETKWYWNVYRLTIRVIRYDSLSTVLKLLLLASLRNFPNEHAKSTMQGGFQYRLASRISLDQTIEETVNFCFSHFCQCQEYV